MSSSIQKGTIELFEIQSSAGGECRLSNPWPGKPVVIREVGKTEAVPVRLDKSNGECLVFATAAGRQYRVVPK